MIFDFWLLFPISLSYPPFILALNFFDVERSILPFQQIKAYTFTKKPYWFLTSKSPVTQIIIFLTFTLNYQNKTAYAVLILEI